MPKGKRKSAGFYLAAAVLLMSCFARTAHCFRLGKAERRERRKEASGAIPIVVQDGKIVFGRVFERGSGFESQLVDGAKKTVNASVEDDATYQADSPVLPKGQTHDAGLSWTSMHPSLQCGGDKLKFRAVGPATSHFAVEQAGNASPMPLSQVPSTCGYTMQRNSLALFMLVPYDGCNVVKEGGSYVLPMRWQGIPVSLWCPKPAPQDPTMAAQTTTTTTTTAPTKAPTTAPTAVKNLPIPQYPFPLFYPNIYPQPPPENPQFPQYPIFPPMYPKVPHVPSITPAQTTSPTTTTTIATQPPAKAPAQKVVPLVPASYYIYPLPWQFPMQMPAAGQPMPKPPVPQQPQIPPVPQQPQIPPVPQQPQIPPVPQQPQIPPAPQQPQIPPAPQQPQIPPAPQQPQIPPAPQQPQIPPVPQQPQIPPVPQQPQIPLVPQQPQFPLVPPFPHYLPYPPVFLPYPQQPMPKAETTTTKAPTTTPTTTTTTTTTTAAEKKHPPAPQSQLGYNYPPPPFGHYPLKMMPFLPPYVQFPGYPVGKNNK